MKVVDPPPPNAEVDYVYFTTRGTDPPSSLVPFAHFDSGWAVAEFAKYNDGGTLDRSSSVPAPPIGAWFHYDDVACHVAP